MWLDIQVHLKVELTCSYVYGLWPRLVKRSLKYWKSVHAEQEKRSLLIARTMNVQGGQRHSQCALHVHTSDGLGFTHIASCAAEFRTRQKLSRMLEKEGQVGYTTSCIGLGAI